MASKRKLKARIAELERQVEQMPPPWRWQVVDVASSDFTVRCTCHDPRTTTSGSKPWCGVHDVLTTYTFEARA